MTPWTAALQVSLFFPVSPSWLKRVSIDSVMPSSHLIFRLPLLLLPSVFPSLRVFSSESALRARWPKYWSISFSNSSSSWFRVDFYSSCRYAPLLLATASVKRQTSCIPGPALKATHSKVHVSNSWGLSSLCSAPYSRCSL